MTVVDPSSHHPPKMIWSGPPRRGADRPTVQGRQRRETFAAALQLSLVPITATSSDTTECSAFGQRQLSSLARVTTRIAQDRKNSRQKLRGDSYCRFGLKRMGRPVVVHNRGSCFPSD